jgi:hypothetical protein
MVQATPNNPDNNSKNDKEDVKPATPELRIFRDDLVPIEIMSDLIFEDIGGQELINISRHDLINGIDIIYQPIKNISSIFFQYNPNNILKLQNTSDAYFKNFPIRLNDKIPECGTGYDLDPVTLAETPNCKYIYIDPKTGDFVVNLIKLDKGEQVEVQILVDGDPDNGTIYYGGLS